MKRIALILAICSSQAGWGQTAWTLNTLSGRPMREVVQDLRERFAWVVSYEEASYDANHIRPAGSKSSAPYAPSMFFSLPASRIANAKAMTGPERRAILEDLVSQHARQGDLRFKVSGDGLHLMPTMPMAPSGALPTPGDAYRSPLDERVRLSPADSYPHLAAAIQDVIAQVAAARGIAIALGTMPMNVVMNNKLYFDVPAASTAREALASILLQVHANPIAPMDQLTWSLMYDPTSRGFFFNVVVVPNSAMPIQIIEAPEPVKNNPGGTMPRGQAKP